MRRVGRLESRHSCSSTLGHRQTGGNARAGCTVKGRPSIRGRVPGGAGKAARWSLCKLDDDVPRLRPSKGDVMQDR